MDLVLASQDGFTEAVFRQCRSFLEDTNTALYDELGDPKVFSNASWLAMVRYAVRKMQRNNGSHGRRKLVGGSKAGWGGHPKGGSPFVEPPISEFNVDADVVKRNKTLGA